jgi:2-keto-myo-inositol isomerase
VRPSSHWSNEHSAGAGQQPWVVRLCQGHPIFSESPLLSNVDPSSSKPASSSRRRFLQATGAGVLACGGGMTTANQATGAALPATRQNRVRYCFNTSTIRGQKLGIVEEIELVAKAGYDGIEPWISEITDYQRDGGSLKDLKKRLDDHGLRVESAIGFANWISDDDDQRKAGLEQAKREMDWVRAIGGTHIAAPPAGATDKENMDLFLIAQRYHDLLDAGREVGVVPQLELWGFSKTLSRLGELVFVASESDHPDACVLPDVYHIYKGGSGFAGLALIAGSAMHAFHMNDYPDMPRDKINDSDRVYPGEGVAPLNEILQTLMKNGFQGALSLELFNRTYWEQPASEVVNTGLEKMKASVAAAQESQAE